MCSSLLKLLLPISLLPYFLLGCSAPVPPVKSLAPQPAPSDTLYLPLHLEDSSKASIALTDSLTRAYLIASLAGLHYFPLDSHLSYKGYDLGRIAFGSGTQGQLVHFEPLYHGYEADYLFLDHAPPKKIQAIEVAFSMWEEGVEGMGTSFLVQNASRTELYIKQYWVNYYGADAEMVVSTDTITSYAFLNDTFIPTSINAAQYRAWYELFEQ